MAKDKDDYASQSKVKKSPRKMPAKRMVVDNVVKNAKVPVKKK